MPTIYTCSHCGAQSAKWLGRCLDCGKWGTLEQTATAAAADDKKSKAQTPPGRVVDFLEIKAGDVARITTGISEFDRVLGGGIVPGSLVLLGGEPGIGKSTLVLQVAAKLSEICGRSDIPHTNLVLYVSGEESGSQIKMRLDRLQLSGRQIKFLGETNIETICATIKELKPRLAIIDSIQTVYSNELPSEAGSVNQVRACAIKLLEVAKKQNITIFLIGHITKEGVVAGPKTLEHLVDTVVYLEGDRHHFFRLLRTVKNRFGETSEVGVFEMQTLGLVEVKNPGAIFLSTEKTIIAGAVTIPTVEGTRIFLAEIQALVSPTPFGYPQRKAAGFDFNRLNLLAAVLTKKAGLNLTNKDIHLNVVGGLKINEPAADLAAALAIASAYKNQAVASDLVAFGEVGLGGEVRAVNLMEKRIKEAAKLGFKKILMPKTTQTIQTNCALVMVGSLPEAIEKTLS